VVAAQRALALSKVQQELMALAINTSAESAVTRQFAAALAKSNLRMAEDILRESGYMIPQGEQTTALLKSMLNETDHDFPIDAVILLIENLTK
jgi:hypothetical protein